MPQSGRQRDRASLAETLLRVVEGSSRATEDLASFPTEDLYGGLFLREAQYSLDVFDDFRRRISSAVS